LQPVVAGIADPGLEAGVPAAGITAPGYKEKRLPHRKFNGLVNV
jgi:hypothetical protein